MIIDAQLEEIGQDENTDSVPSINLNSKLNSLESWARTIKYTPVRQGVLSANGDRLPDTHNLGDVFHFEDGVTLMDAWKHVGGDRVGVVKRPAKGIMFDGTEVEIKDKNWVYPTLDGIEFNRSRPIEAVSNRRYEIINPQSVVAQMDEHFKDIDGNPLIVTAIAFSGDLNYSIIQFERPAMMIRNDWVKRYFTVCIPIMGSVIASSMDARFFCTNKIPSLYNNSFIRIKHLTGANDNLKLEFSNITTSLDMALKFQSELYTQLINMPVREGDYEKVVHGLYPYKGLPSGYDQNVETSQVFKWVEDIKAGRKLRQDIEEMPLTNKKIAELRGLCRVGYESAREEIGDNLWALSQINYAPNHYKTRRQEALVHDMLIKGWRRQDTLQSFVRVVSLGMERGLKVPEKIAPIVRKLIKERSFKHEVADESFKFSRMLKSVN